jgi:hypothetical protein
LAVCSELSEIRLEKPEIRGGDWLAATKTVDTQRDLETNVNDPEPEQKMRVPLSEIETLLACLFDNSNSPFRIFFSKIAN